MRRIRETEVVGVGIEVEVGSKVVALVVKRSIASVPASSRLILCSSSTAVIIVLDCSAVC